MQDEPSRLLRDAEIAAQRRGGDTLRMVRNQPDRSEPDLKRQLGVLKDAADRDREIAAAFGAAVHVLPAQRIGLGAVAVGANRPIRPPDGLEMVDCRLWILKGNRQVSQGLKLRQYGLPRMHHWPNLHWAGAVHPYEIASILR